MMNQNLRPCPDCGRKVSQKALLCPGCGRKRPCGLTWGEIFLRVLIVLVILGLIAAIVIPNTLTSRRAKNEKAVTGDLKSIKKSTEKYLVPLKKEKSMPK